MNYAETLQMLIGSIRSVEPTLTKLSLQDKKVAKSLEAVFNQPSKKFPMIHVTGTNGKGSVALKLSKGFSLAGYKVGLFSSPHIACFRERIKINDEYISEEDFSRLAQLIWSKARQENLSPMFFETLVVMALLYFSEQKVDIAIIEVGIGGKEDSTNFITPILSVITSISNDHVPFLGQTLEDIAFHKAGIIKESIPVALGPTAQNETILSEAKKKKSPLMFSSATGGFFDEENIDLAALCLKTLSKTYPQITDEVICQAVKQRPLSRFEVLPSFLAKRLMPENTLPEFIVMDVAHNEAGIDAVFEAIKLKLGQAKVRVLFGVSNTRQNLVKKMITKASAVHVLPISHQRLEDPKKVFEQIQSLNYEKVYYNCDLKETIKEALLLAKENEEVLLVCGSFYIMKDVRAAFGFKDCVDEALEKLPSA